jgi:hypothetical protein
MTRAIVSCALGKPAEIRTSKNGKTFATSVRESLNGSTRWWQAIAFNENVIEAVKELSVGEGLAVAGEITAEITRLPGLKVGSLGASPSTPC